MGGLCLRSTAAPAGVPAQGTQEWADPAPCSEKSPLWYHSEHTGFTEHDSCFHRELHSEFIGKYSTA